MKLYFEELSWGLGVRILELTPIRDLVILLENVIAGFITPVLGLLLFATINAT